MGFLTIILIVLQIAAIVILNINKHLQGEIAEKLEIKLEGSYDLYTMFFGATTGVSILYLKATLCFCRSVKDSETSGKYSTEMDRFQNRAGLTMKKFHQKVILLVIIVPSRFI